jgi:hypothetical protein
MNRSAVVAVLVLAALTGIFLVNRDEAKTSVQSPMIIERVKNMNRVEIVPPGSSEDAELIVLQRRDDTWQMTRPVQSRLTPSATAKLGTLFAKDIRTDDLRLSTEKRADYGLDTASSIKLSAYSEGDDTAAVELDIGKEIAIAQSGARRTYLKRVDKDELYRAQVALGDFVGQSADDLRSKSIVDIDPVAITAVSITHAHGAKIRIARAGDAWELVAPLVGAEAMNELDQAKTKRLINTLARVRAAGFADDKKPEDIGLLPALVSAKIETIDDGAHVLAIGNQADSEKVYARFDDGPVFTVPKSAANRLGLKADGLLISEKTQTHETVEKTP